MPFDSAARRPAKILLVATDRILMTLMNFALSKRGCQVDIVTNGLKAMREIEEGLSGYDALITCDDLPVMTGADLCREAKKICKGIKVIGVTDDSPGDNGLVPPASNAGGYDYYIRGGLKVQKINDALDFVLNNQERVQLSGQRS